MPEFLTVKEAAKRTAKSPSSIRRIIYPIIHDDTHPDREHVQPNVDDALALRTKGENFAWRLSEELLRREVPIESSEKGSASTPQRGTPSDSGELLTMLRRELDIKNEQISHQSGLIAKQMELIDGLSERLREGNHLIASLQHRLSLPDGNERSRPDPIHTKTPTKPRSEKGSKGPTKPKKPRGSFLYRLFRR